MTRIKIGLSGLLAIAILSALGGGISLQHQWDAECNAAHPGTRWNGDLWMCVEKGRG